MLNFIVITLILGAVANASNVTNITTVESVTTQLLRTIPHCNAYKFDELIEEHTKLLLDVDWSQTFAHLSQDDMNGCDELKKRIEYLRNLHSDDQGIEKFYKCKVKNIGESIYLYDLKRQKTGFNEWNAIWNEFNGNKYWNLDEDICVYHVLRLVKEDGQLEKLTTFASEFLSNRQFNNHLEYRKGTKNLSVIITNHLYMFPNNADLILKSEQISEDDALTCLNELYRQSELHPNIILALKQKVSAEKWPRTDPKGKPWPKYLASYDLVEQVESALSDFCIQKSIVIHDDNCKKFLANLIHDNKTATNEQLLKVAQVIDKSNNRELKRNYNYFESTVLRPILLKLPISEWDKVKWTSETNHFLTEFKIKHIALVSDEKDRDELCKSLSISGSGDYSCFAKDDAKYLNFFLECPKALTMCDWNSRNYVMDQAIARNQTAIIDVLNRMVMPLKFLKLENLLAYRNGTTRLSDILPLLLSKDAYLFLKSEKISEDDALTCLNELYGTAHWQPSIIHALKQNIMSWIKL